MSLIVETGAGIVGSESYCSVADSLTYHANRGNTTWATITTIEQEQALRRATDYMVQVYRSSWRGYRVSETQSLDWPREKVYLTGETIAVNEYSSTSVPIEVANACAEFALKAAGWDLLEDTQDKVIKEVIGPIATTYSESTNPTKKYLAIHAMIKPFLKNTAGSVMRN
jgi:hypothetical protein